MPMAYECQQHASKWHRRTTGACFDTRTPELAKLSHGGGGHPLARQQNRDPRRVRAHLSHDARRQHECPARTSLSLSHKHCTDHLCAESADRRRDFHVLARAEVGIPRRDRRQSRRGIRRRHRRRVVDCAGGFGDRVGRFGVGARLAPQCSEEAPRVAGTAARCGRKGCVRGA